MEIKTNIIKVGHSFYFPVPKALIDCKVLDPKKDYTLQVVDKKENLENGYIPFRSPDLDTFINKGVLA